MTSVEVLPPPEVIKYFEETQAQAGSAHVVLTRHEHRADEFQSAQLQGLLFVSSLHLCQYGYEILTFAPASATMKHDYLDEVCNHEDQCPPQLTQHISMVSQSQEVASPSQVEFEFSIKYDEMYNYLASTSTGIIRLSGKLDTQSGKVVDVKFGEGVAATE
jgi:hypothetical protein